jgi:hypothetical protein
MWPGRLQRNPNYGWAYLDLPGIRGAVIKAYENMALAHRKAYHLIKSFDTQRADMNAFSSAQVGIAHNVAFYQSSKWMKPLASLLDNMLNWDFMDRIEDCVDFLGMVSFIKTICNLFGIELLWNRNCITQWRWHTQSTRVFGIGSCHFT